MPIMIWVATIACMLEMMSGAAPPGSERADDRLDQDD